MSKRQPISEYELDKLYRDFLDDLYPECEIAGMKYCTSTALAEIDPTAFRCGFADWLDSECQSGTYEEINGEYFHA